MNARLSTRTLEQAALLALALRVLSLPALLLYLLLRREGGGWYSLPDLLGSAALLTLWGLLLRDLFAGRAARLNSTRLAVLRVSYPWLAAYQGALWVLAALGFGTGMYPEANPAAVFILLSVWVGGIVINLLLFLLSVRLFPNPADQTGRRQLSDLLNVAAALSLASTIINVVPLAGAPAPTHADQWAYLLAGVAELASLLLLRLALQRPAPEQR
ncbi:hypothetical protein [Deinococcus sonorensis]|uniref:Cation transporter n=2 Tax=Deinococcus sonorensis TaxID=309891 RepID=A0AAU7U8I1_9DEIO